ncbi:MAG: hypothetical protein KME06_12420 [Kastovskya adunca ATA6-11-RM4]|jgi:hypothetical protein|nr:hypothetical protein [Kastovskya adunca ATA6-11-RM4]
MTESSPGIPESNPQPDATTVNYEDLLLLLRRKEQTWVEWGQACATLQKAGYNSQTIFEETGFEPIQQNQVIVAAQVYASIVSVGVSEEVRSRYSKTGSDSLYELRILNQVERAAAAELLYSKNLDSEGAKEVAKAMKEFSRYSTLPEGFTEHPGDGVAFYYWRLARQQTDLQERSRLIARGLMFANSQSARQQIEKLLTEPTNSTKRPVPTLPLYRIEAEDELPCLVPVAGQFPLTAADVKNVQPLKKKGAFQIIEAVVGQLVVTIPGWKVVLNAQDPVAMVCNSSQLPTKVLGKPEDMLVLIDRGNTTWDDGSYFLVDKSDNVQIQWTDTAPDAPILGRLLLIMRPKKIIDEPLNQDVWQIDE